MKTFSSKLFERLFIALLIAWLAIGGALPFLPAGLQAGQAAAEGVSGVSGRADARAADNLTELARREALQPWAAQQPVSVPPFMNVPEVESGLPLPPTANDDAFAPAMPSAPSPAPAASFLALEDNIASIPPDTHGAVGPNHVMTALNPRVRIQDRAGVTISTVSLNMFWSSVNGGSGAFDPKTLYDPYANRWISVACDDSVSATSGILIGVSQTNDPTGVWNKYKTTITGASEWYDYPSIGFNKNWIVVSINVFSFAGSFKRSEILAFNKADLYAGGAGTFTRFTDSVGTWAPAETFDNSLDTLYLLQTYSSTSGSIRLGKITGAVGAEVFSTGTGNYLINYGSGWASSAPGGLDFAPQLGSAQLIQNNDSRMQQVVYRNEHLWATHTIFLPSTTPTRSGAQWWQILPNNPPTTAPAIIQKGRIEDPGGVYFYAFPSIAVNANDDVLIGFSRFAANQYASANYAFRAGGDPINTMRSDVVLKAGEAPYYKTYSGTRNRWGDYSHSQVDPLNDLDFWTIQEYAWTNDGTYDRWSTWWGKVVAPPAAFSKAAPVNGAAGMWTGVKLSWASSSNAASYEYCIDPVNDNACTLPAVWTNTAANTFAALSGLNPNTTYYWQARAINFSETVGANSDTWWSFTTGGFFNFLLLLFQG